MPPCHHTAALESGRGGRLHGAGMGWAHAIGTGVVVMAVLGLVGCAAGGPGSAASGALTGKPVAGAGGAQAAPGLEADKAAAGARCEPEPSLMTPCPAPVVLKPGMTYKELLEAHLSDRQQLQRCAARHDELRKAILACHWVAP